MDCFGLNYILGLAGQEQLEPLNNLVSEILSFILLSMVTLTSLISRQGFDF